MSHKADSVHLKAKCEKPIDAWQCGTRVCKDGIVSPNIVFSQKEAFDYFSSRFGGVFREVMDKHHVPMPCGKCRACALRKRKDWTTRITHEMEMHDCESCCMVTLTYNDDNVPMCLDVDTSVHRSNDLIRKENYNRTLLPRDVQLFLKRLRRHLEYIPKKPQGKRDHIPVGSLRYFAVGEYGSKTGRPHYHILLFGWCPSDLDYFFTRNGHDIFRSKQIEKIWTLGYSTVQHVGVGCAKYVARYVSKKMGDDAGAKDGKRFPEFYLQSVRNGGIGSLYFDRYLNMIVSQNYCNVRSAKGFYKSAIPSYYVQRLRKMHPDFYVQFRDQRLGFLKDKTVIYDYAELSRGLEAMELFDKRARANDFF